MRGGPKSRPGRAAGEARKESDRRLARGSATRATILDATAALLREGVSRPTSAQVARRAGVSRRLVFYYFSRMEQLVVAAAETRLGAGPGMLAPLPSGWPVELRIEVVCEHRRELFEQLRPAFVVAGTSGGGGDHGRSALPDAFVLRDQLAETFAPEVRRLGEHGPMVLDWLDFVTGPEHWRFQRNQLGKSPQAATHAIATMLRRTLARD